MFRLPPPAVLRGDALHGLGWGEPVLQSEYLVWIRFPHLHLECIYAHESLCFDMANTAKQGGNVSMGPWWRYFRPHEIARVLRDQFSTDPPGSIASGFTAARFIEMIVAKYSSLCLAIRDALSSMIEDDSLSLCSDFDVVHDIVQTPPFENPSNLHHLPNWEKGA